MRQLCILFLVLILGTGIAHAAPGDTTWVQANKVRLTYYNDYDTIVRFPNGSTSYKKVLMYFTLGKYQCPGYNPSNPGEVSQGGTGWCGDWDYTVQNILMTPQGDTLELGRLITPYANTNWPRTPWTWKQPYVFDVTDFYPALRDSATVRIHYSGYSGGFTANIRFAFVEGTLARPVLGIRRLWHGDFAYGHGATPINTALDTLAYVTPTGTAIARARINITGHGGDDNSCAEFCPNVYTLKQDNTVIVRQNFFRETCGDNDLYPQSGTWIYDRANWCPGASVLTFTHPVSLGAHRLNLSFPPYTSPTTQGGSPASYTLDGAVIYYGAPTTAFDVALEEVKAPTSDPRFFRLNPFGGAPIVTVRNLGGDNITQLNFTYGADGHTQTYTWIGNLPASASTDVVLPPIPTADLTSGTHNFTVSVDTPPSDADIHQEDNHLTTTYTGIPSWPNRFAMQFKANDQAHASRPGVSQTSWRIESLTDSIYKMRNNCRVNALCRDTVDLPVGQVFHLVVADTVFYAFRDIPTGTDVGHTGGDGVRGFTNVSGYIRALNLGVNTRIAIPAGLTGNFEGNFGGGFTQYFITAPTVSISPASAPARLELSPNPATDKVGVQVEGNAVPGVYLVQDLLGRTVLTVQAPVGSAELDVHTLPNGAYRVRFLSVSGKPFQPSPLIIAR